ncbi:plakophilin-1-like [Rhinoraja longicauda]
MAYLRTVTAGQTFNKQDNSTLALPPANKLSTLGRVDSEKRVNSQVRLMMQNKHETIRRDTSKDQWNTNQQDIFNLGNRIQNMSMGSHGSRRHKSIQFNGITNGFSLKEDGQNYGPGITRGTRQRNVFSTYSMKGNRSISTPSYRKYSGPTSPQGDDVDFHGISTSRSEPDLVNVGTLPVKRRVRNKSRTVSRTKSLFVRRPGSFHPRQLSDRRSPANVKLVGHSQTWKKVGAQNPTEGVRELVEDMNLRKAVGLLSNQDPNILVYASSYIQHDCFKEDSAKVAIYQMGAIPQLINLLRTKDVNVQQSACAALRNAVYKNVINKVEVKRNDGIKQVLQLLRETRDPETKKQITGLLWNLSSCDDLKEDLINDALPVLTEYTIIPHTSQGLKSLETLDSDTFHNATGCLRNLSSAGESGRQRMRNSPGFIDSLMSHVQTCLAANQADEKSIENCVCILHNLSYHLDSEVPSAFAHINENGNSQQTKKMSKRSSAGCFSPGTDHLEEADLSNLYFSQEENNPKGVNNLFHSKAVKMYSTLLEKSKCDATLEASAGALQNLTAGNKVSSYLMSSALVDKDRAIPQVAKLLLSTNPDVQKTAVSLLNNVSRHSNLQPQLASQTLPYLARLLPSAGSSATSSDDTIASACNIMRNLVPKNTTLAKTVLQGSMLKNLIHLSRSSTNPASGKAACLFLYEMWNQKDLHSFLRKEGFAKKDFVNNLTSAAVKVAQQNVMSGLGKRFMM